MLELLCVNVKKATGGICTPLMAFRILFGFVEPDVLKASDGDGYYYRYPYYRGGNNNSA